MDILTTGLQLWDTFLGRVIGSLIIAGLAYLVLKLGIPLVTRQTRYEIDDVIVGILRWPLPLIVVFSGLVSALPLAGLPEHLVSIGTSVYVVLLTIIIAYLLLKILSDVIVLYAEEHARESESNLDDVLVPLLTRRIIPLVIFITAIIVGLWAIGVDLGAALTGLGALSFLLIFLFQEPLSNLFSGVYLVLDVPFKYGDLIVLEDGETYHVRDIGTRVTKLYNIDKHTLVFVPNNKLAGQQLTNLTRPNVELRMKMQVGVAYDTRDLARVQELLVEAANAHPHVLGDFSAKKNALSRKMEQTTTDENQRMRLAMELERLAVENGTRLICEDLIHRLQFLRQFVHDLEAGGLDPRERRGIQTTIDQVWPMVGDMRRKFTIWVHLVGRLDATYKWNDYSTPLTAAEVERRLPHIEQLEEWRRTRAGVDEIKSWLLKNNNLAVLGVFPNVDEEFYLAGSTPWLEFSREIASQESRASMGKALKTWMEEQPTWAAFKDYYALYQGWHKPIRDLLRRLDECSHLEQLRGEAQFRLDSRLDKVITILEEKFLLRTPGWQAPGVDFIGFGASSIDFRLEFFVDDLVREHFELLDDVFSEVGLEIMDKFSAEGIEIPFPQMDVSFRNEWLKDVVQKYRSGD